MRNEGRSRVEVSGVPVQSLRPAVSAALADGLNQGASVVYR